MTGALMTGNAAAAWGARLAGADYVPAFPITPQTEIIETLAGWIGAGAMPGRITMLESEHSMIAAAGAAAATGVRVFTATSSQGLLYGLEMLWTCAGWRTPFVLVNVSRALASPITLEADHNDVLAARDSGALQIHCATCQEVVDTVLMAYRLGEHAAVRLPVIVNIDGFQLSFTREPVELPEARAAADFVGPFRPGALKFRASHPIAQAVAVLGGSTYSYFRYEMQRAAEAALSAHMGIAAEFTRRFGRHYGAVEAYRMDDAEFAYVMIGSFASKARDAVDRLRAQGWRIGLVRPRLFRPFPAARIRELLGPVKAVAVIDQNISIGAGGILAGEIAGALYASPRRPLILSYVGGLGGRDIAPAELDAMAAELKRAAATGIAPNPRLLFTGDELREVRKLQAIAAVERQELEAAP
ncbi:MAG TPA: pyruvate synthase [Alphaproteobacteria bacterium]|jgi:pyruvate ferredoxin oxidoreductase alpha subunit